MKRIVSLLLATLLVLSLCACDSGKGKGTSTGSDLTWEQIEKQADKELKKEGNN